MLTTLQASTASSPGLTAELVGSSAHLWLLHTKLGITNVTKIPRNAISLAGTLVLSTKYCHCFFTSVPTNVIRRRTLRNTGTCVRRAAVVGQLEREGAQRYDRLPLSRSPPIPHRRNRRRESRARAPTSALQSFLGNRQKWEELLKVEKFLASSIICIFCATFPKFRKKVWFFGG